MNKESSKTWNIFRTDSSLKDKQKYSAGLTTILAYIQQLNLEDHNNGPSLREKELFRRVKKEYNHGPKNAEETVMGLLRVYWELEEKLQKFILQGIQHESLLKERDQTINKLEQERSTLKVNIVRLQNDSNLATKQHDDRIANMVAAHQKEMIEERKKHKEAKAQTEGIEAEYKGLLGGLKFESEEQLAKAQRNFNFEKKKMSNEYEEDIEAWKTRYKINVAKLKNDAESKQAKLENRIATQEATYKIEIARLEEEAASKQSELERRHARQVEAVRREHSAQEARLRSDITTLNRALLAREAFDPPTDHDLTEPFEDLFVELDQSASNVSKFWKSQESGWTDELLARLAPQNQQRTIRKQIVHDSVWIILNKDIFCSPFRVFGEEGQRLEAEWKEGYPEGFEEEKGLYDWPAPSMDSERWRYDTMKPLQDALKKLASKHDARAAIKQGFETALNDTREELLEMLQGVAKLDQAALSRWSNICRKAAEIWIAMGTQRCRLRVIVPGGELTEQADRVKKAQREGLQLVISPEFRRYGDPRGQDLEKAPESMIKGDYRTVLETR